MRQSLDVVALSGSLHPAAVPGDRYGTRKFTLAESQAVARALSDLFGAEVSPSSIVDTKKVKARYHSFDLAPGTKVKGEVVRFASAARVKKVFFPLPDRLLAGYFVEFEVGPEAKTSSSAYRYVIAADDGRLLYRENLTHHDTFNYRVWADATGDKRPLDGPTVSFSPHPTGKPDGSYPAFVKPNLVSMAGFNKNGAGTFDPWLPSGALETRGNNVDAYTDIQAPDGFSGGDFRASTTGANAFDRIYDVTKDPLSSEAQGMAAVGQIFYVTNWLHDWWYDSGFNEAAGNAQQDNYGRGGIAGDPLLAEGEDDANSPDAIDNANMVPMSDGQSPRMQMYLWNAKSPAARPDGTIDNTIVAHEWGHYIHLRQVDCGSKMCDAESEGWGDFHALQMILRPEDNLDGVFALAIYATASFGDSGYFGIRRVPYSVDFSKNALTFKHITRGVPLPKSHPVLTFGDNNEPHNAGEIWTTMLFERTSRC